MILNRPKVNVFTIRNVMDLDLIRHELCVKLDKVNELWRDWILGSSKVL